MPTQVTVVTVGGDRPECLALLEKYMARQTNFGDFAWLIVDDSLEPMPTTMGQDVIKLPYEPDPSLSFRKNMLVALTGVKTKGVVICEIDDCYARTYVEEQADILRYKQLSGRSFARYYHCPTRSWMVHSNNQHASLCQTAFSGEQVRQAAVDYLNKGVHPSRLDGHLWRRAGLPIEIKCIIPGGTVTVGIKGAWGRPGLGIHHRPEELAGYTPDPELKQLRKWIGEDADAYAPLYQPPETEPLPSGE